MKYQILVQFFSYKLSVEEKRKIAGGRTMTSGRGTQSCCGDCDSSKRDYDCGGTDEIRIQLI